MRMTTLRKLLAGIGIAVLLAGCGQSDRATQGGSSAPQPSLAPSAPAAEQEVNVQVYYADSDLAGLVQRETTIRYEDADAKYLRLLQALQKSGDPEAVPLLAGIRILSVDFADGRLTVDLEIPDDARLGGSGELFLLQSLQKTVFQFDEVTELHLLVEGEAVDSLMGHVKLPHPIEKNTEL